MVSPGVLVRSLVGVALLVVGSVTMSSVILVVMVAAVAVVAVVVWLV